MSKFKVGDKVRVRENLKVNETYDDLTLWPGKMADSRGKEFTISCIKNTNHYKCDGSEFIWSEQMLEPVCKFKVGDKVIGNEKANCYAITKEGWIGTVKSIRGDCISVAGEGIFSTVGVLHECFDLYEEPKTQKIVITTDGKTTTAVLYDGKKRIKDAKAICAPTDTFDFNYGASLALDRLTGFVRGSVDCTLEENSDWDKFIAGEIVFEMTKDKFDAFLKEVEKKFPNLRWCDKQKPTAWKPYAPKCYFRVDEGDLCWGTNADIESIQWTPDGLDWNKFAHGELTVKVGKEKFDEFMKLCEEKNFRWFNNKFATAINPWKLYDNMPHFLKTFVNLAGDMPHEYIWISVEDEVLKFGTKSDEDIDEYEFV